MEIVYSHQKAIYELSEYEYSQHINDEDNIYFLKKNGMFQEERNLLLSIFKEAHVQYNNLDIDDILLSYAPGVYYFYCAEYDLSWNVNTYICWLEESPDEFSIPMTKSDVDGNVVRYERCYTQISDNIYIMSEWKERF